MTYETLEGTAVIWKGDRAIRSRMDMLDVITTATMDLLTSLQRFITWPH